jgi:hypothetical protein
MPGQITMGIKLQVGIPDELKRAIGAADNIIESATVIFDRGPARIQVTIIPSAENTVLGKMLQNYDLMMVQHGK